MGDVRKTHVQLYTNDVKQFEIVYWEGNVGELLLNKHSKSFV